MKGKRIWSGLLALVFCLGLLPAAALAADDTDITTEGSWTDQNNYDISWYTGAASDTTEFTLFDAADLAGLAVIVNGLYEVTGDEDWNKVEATLGGTRKKGEILQDDFEGKNVKLGTDVTINLSDKNWTPIGSSYASPFKGTFDGSGATITGLTITDGSRNAGLFGHVDGGTIQNVTLTEVSINISVGYQNIAVGGIAACVYGSDANATVSQCSVSGTITVAVSPAYGTQTVGGIVGANRYSIASGTITPELNFSTAVSGCEFSGEISSAGTATGGIAGRSCGGIQNCTNKGTVDASADAPVGGIVGLIDCDYYYYDGSATSSVEGCDNQGKIISTGTTIEAAAGGIVGVIRSTTGTDRSDVVCIEKCCNSGEIESKMTSGGILGRMHCTQYSGLGSVEISQCYNAGKIQAKKEFESTTTGAGGLIGVLAYGKEERVTVKDSYNVEAVSGGTKNNTGGLLGATLTNTNGTAGTISLTSCYNAGKLTGHNSYTGGILGRDGAGSSAKLTHCYFWEDCGVTGENSKSANYMTEDDTWSTNLGLDPSVWEKSENNLSESNNLIGYLPVLTENKQDPAPTLTRSAKRDQDPLTISGLPSGTINETCAEFTLTAAGGTGDGAVTWESSNTKVAIVNSGKVTITGVGPVTITATKAGGNDYNDATASVDFTVYGRPISEVTILNLAAPVQGTSPVQNISVPDGANYKALTGLGIGSPQLDVIWKDESDTSVSTFEQNKIYTATIRLKADDYYSFADSVNVSLGSVQSTAYSKIETDKEEDGSLTVTVTFKATNHTHSWETEWSRNATHHWHACQSDGCPLSESGMQGYNQHVDTDDDGICDTCNATIGYLITFDAGGGTCDQNDARTDVNGNLSSLPTPTRGNYTFDGWFTMATGGEKVTTDTVFTQDTTIYAHWTAVSSGGSSRPTYPPIVTDTAGGDTSVAPARPHKGDTVTITPKPDQGNEVDSVTVTDRNGDPVKVTDKGDGTYTFTQPTGKVTITVTFRDKEDQPTGLPFTDVAPGAWYYDAVAYAYEHGLMHGTSATTFSPNGTTTRAQIVTILWRLVDSPAGEAPADFADVDPAAWYGEAVRWAAGQGIVGGYGNGSFGPNDPVTREQLAAILYRFAQHMGYDTEGQADLSGFTDLAQGSTYAREAMAWCVDAGLLSGTSPTTLSPRGQATRAQTAAVLMRLCQGYGM